MHQHETYARRLRSRRSHRQQSNKPQHRAITLASKLPSPRHRSPHRRSWSRRGKNNQPPNVSEAARRPCGSPYDNNNRQEGINYQVHVSALPAYLLAVSRTIELSLQSSFQLSLTVLVCYRTSVIFSLRWSLPPNLCCNLKQHDSRILS